MTGLSIPCPIISPAKKATVTPVFLSASSGPVPAENAMMNCRHFHPASGKLPRYFLK
jgi:hypothetical protein